MRGNTRTMALQSRPHRILLTRPADQGARFGQALLQRFGSGAEIVFSPLSAPRHLFPVLPSGTFDAVIFTSETAVAASVGLRPGLPGLAFTVGDQTALAAQAAGFKAVSAAGDAAALIALLVGSRPGRLLHLHGQETRGDVVPHLVAAGIDALGCVVYAQEPVEPSRAALLWLADAHPVAVPLFSPRMALRFSSVAGNARAPLWLASLSPAVDAAVTLVPAQRIVARRPDAMAMLDALALLLIPFADP